MVQFSSQARSQKIASDGAHNLARGPCIKNVIHDKSITGKLVMNPRHDFARNVAILSKFACILHNLVPICTNIYVKYPKIMNTNW